MYNLKEIILERFVFDENLKTLVYKVDMPNCGKKSGDVAGNKGKKQ